MLPSSERVTGRGLPIEAAGVALVATASAAVALAPGAMVLLSVVGAAAPAASASPLVFAVIAVAAVHALALVALGRRWAFRVGIAAGLVAAFGTAFVEPARRPSWPALVLVAVLETWAAGALAERLRAPLSGVLRRRRVASTVWAALGLLLVVQSARLSIFMADPSFDFWLTTRDPVWAKHMCMPAYIEGADLLRQGAPNIYDARYYLVMDRSAKPGLTVRNMDAWAGDPFQYPPAFLVFPRLALAATDDFAVLRTLWYVVQVFLFLGVAITLCLWIGGSAGGTAALLIPAVWISIPGIQSLQYGQFHMAALSLALAGMLAFERRRNAAGGLLLAIATLAKIFPGVLVLWLIAQQRWRAVDWTAGCTIAVTAIAMMTLGVAPFLDFVHYQLPRLANGRAFDFSAAWPELRAPFIANNLSPAAMVEKLGELHVPGMTRAAGLGVLRLYTLALVAFVLVAGRRRVEARQDLAVVWLALLNLAAFQSYGAWGDYVTLGSAWALTLAASSQWPAARTWSLPAGLLGAAWIACFLVPGVQPIPDLLPSPVAMILTLLVAAIVIALNARTALVGANVLGRPGPRGETA